MDTWRTDIASLSATGQPLAQAFKPFTPWLNHLDGPAWPALARLNTLADQQKLNNAKNLPIQFISQTLRCSQRDYETSIYNTGNVPSREDNWHDFFNALIWLALPKTKAMLNAIHQTELPRGNNRTSVSDAATLFDESGLILVSEDDLIVNLLRARRWQEACIEHRHHWQQLKAYVVGHAILEKWLAPYPGITTKCLHLKLPADSPLHVIDAANAHLWQQQPPASADLLPMPISGIPGWWPDNEKASFYCNEKVFRPPR